jgi:hypothetical protein
MAGAAVGIDVRDYLLGLGGALKSADVFIPIPFAASALGIEQTTIRAYVRSGQLKPFLLTSEWDEKWTGVSGRSLLKELQARDQQVADLVDPIIYDLKELGGERIEYGKLMPKFGLSANNPHHRNLIGQVLGEVSKRSYDEHKVMLSVQVVRKHDQLPSEPFFDLAVGLGAMREDTDHEEFVKRHLRKIRELAEAGYFE